MAFEGAPMTPKEDPSAEYADSGLGVPRRNFLGQGMLLALLGFYQRLWAQGWLCQLNGRRPNRCLMVAS